ncbi:MAG: CooT family nickel-binding protein [bacterium]
MCESHAYVLRNGREEKVLDDVTLLKPEAGSIVLKNLFGDEVRIRGRVEEIRFMDHKIILKEEL